LRAKAGGGRLDLALERRISALLDEQTVPAYQRKQRRLNELQILQYERKQALEAISDRLQGNKAADIRALALKSRALESAIGSIEKSQRNNERRSNTVAADWQKLAKQLGRLPGARPEVVLEAGFFRYVDDVLGATVDEYRERVRAHVESDAQEMFLNLIRDPAGYGGLRISPDYKIELLDNHNEQRPTSEGGKQLLALALIGALKKAAVRGGPVVLDSPLARLDLPHRANVLKTWIPSLGAQAILLVQSGELTPPDASDLLGGLIGHSYQISRPTADPEYAVIEKLR
jgi:DNA sulfur modification protein DndD